MGGHRSENGVGLEAIVSTPVQSITQRPPLCFGNAVVEFPHVGLQFCGAIDPILFRSRLSRCGLTRFLLRVETLFERVDGFLELIDFLAKLSGIIRRRWRGLSPEPRS